MPMIEVTGVSYDYGRVRALDGLDLVVPEGALYALIGPNGAGKTTLMQLLMGLRRQRRGEATVMGVDTRALTARDRARMGYVSEGQVLPGWMRMDQLEAYLAPLYPTWDAAFAGELRRRFAIAADRPIRTLSRGERMKAALLCALAPRPRVLFMDEPFSGMDVMVKDELIDGLLGSARAEGWTVIVSSHDIGELEMLADWVGFLDRGRLAVSEPMESLLSRMRYVEILDPSTADTAAPVPGEWISVRRSGDLITGMVSNGTEDLSQAVIAPSFPHATHIDVRRPTLREVFLALGRRGDHATEMEVSL